MNSLSSQRGDKVQKLVNVKPRTSFKVSREDPISPPQKIDQFAPLLSKKLIRARRNFTNRTLSNSTESLETTSRDISALRVPMVNKFAQSAETFDDCRGPRNNLDDHIKCEELFDTIAFGSFDKPMSSLFEESFQGFFKAQQIHFFHDIPSIKFLYCPTLGVSIPHGSGLVGYCHYSREIVKLFPASSHGSYVKEIDRNLCPENSAALVIPLIGINGIHSSVIEIIRDTPFTTAEIDAAEYFQTKFKRYSHILFQQKVPDKTFVEFSKINRMKKYIYNTCTNLTDCFGCKKAEIWEYDNDTAELLLYKKESGEPKNVKLQNAGIVAYALVHQISISAKSSDRHSAYNSNYDTENESIFVLTLKSTATNKSYAIALRGKLSPSFFTDSDESILSRVAPTIIESFVNSKYFEKTHAEFEETKKKLDSIKFVLDISKSICAQLRKKELIPHILRNACSIVQSDNSILFEPNERETRLIASLQTPAKNQIIYGMNEGIAGRCFSSKEIINIKDAYEDTKYIHNADDETGYKSRELLCVPVLNDKNNPCAVIQATNKESGFTKEDEKTMEIFSGFCGISLQNAALYDASLQLSIQLNKILQIPQKSIVENSLYDLIGRMLYYIRVIIGTSRAIFYMNNEKGFSVFAFNEDLVAEEKRTGRKIDYETDDGRKAAARKMITGRKNQVWYKSRSDESRNEFVEKCKNQKVTVSNDTKLVEEMLICTPVFSSNREELYGEALLQWKKRTNFFSEQDKEIFEALSIFITYVIEKFHKK